MGTKDLEAARQAIRPSKEHGTVRHLQATYRKKFDSSLLVQSRKDIADLLDEEAEPMSIREKLRQSYEQANKHRHTNKRDQER